MVEDIARVAEAAVSEVGAVVNAGEEVISAD